MRIPLKRLAQHWRSRLISGISSLPALREVTTLDKLAYSAKELAVMLGISKTQVLDWAHRGIIPAKQPAGKGGRVIFPKRLVDAWLEELQTDVKPRKLRAVR